MMAMDTQEIGAALARQEEQIKGLARRMDNLEKLTESVNKLAISVERLTAQQAATDTQIETLTGDVNEIKSKPAKRWDTVIAAIISALIGAGITLLIKG
jgi:archaellum component FlaC